MWLCSDRFLQAHPTVSPTIADPLVITIIIISNRAALPNYTQLIGERTVVLEERSDVWINLYHMLHTFTPAWRLPGDSAGKDDFYFLWASEHTGFAQLYLYCYDAAARTGVKVAGPIGGGGEFVVER